MGQNHQGDWRQAAMSAALAEISDARGVGACTARVNYPVFFDQTDLEPS